MSEQGAAAQIMKRCPSCGFLPLPDATHCPKCGKPIESAARASVVAAMKAERAIEQDRRVEEWFRKREAQRAT